MRSDLRPVGRVTDWATLVHLSFVFRLPQCWLAQYLPQRVSVLWGPNKTRLGQGPLSDSLWNPKLTDNSGNLEPGGTVTLRGREWSG